MTLGGAFCYAVPESECDPGNERTINVKIDPQIVRKLRTAKGWSQEQLSEAGGLNTRTVQRIESTGKASLESARLLAAALDVDPDVLIDREQTAPLTPVTVVKRAFVEFDNFSDRASRYEYWWFLLFVLLLSALATVVHEGAVVIVGLLVLLPLLAVGTRRLNDAGHSGWWQLMLLVPFGQVVVLMLLAQKSKG